MPLFSLYPGENPVQMDRAFGRGEKIESWRNIRLCRMEVRAVHYGGVRRKDRMRERPVRDNWKM